jgi:hypothetical protein
VSTLLWALSLASGAVTVVAASSGKHGTSGTFLVTGRQLGSATAFDAATGGPLWTTTVGAAPIGIVQPRGTDEALTSDEASDQMPVLDRRTGSCIGTNPPARTQVRRGERMMARTLEPSPLSSVAARHWTAWCHAFTSIPAGPHPVFMARAVGDRYPAASQGDLS